MEVEVESTDKGGNFVGWLYVEGKNLSLLLVQVCERIIRRSSVFKTARIVTKPVWVGSCRWVKAPIPTQRAVQKLI